MRATNLIICLFVVIFFIGCGTMEMTSKWRDQDIKIDGSQDDWRDALTYIQDKKISVGVLNDENSFYACLVTANRRIQSQIMRMGFTIWFDSKGGKDKNSGIRFPIGKAKMDRPMMRDMMRDPQGSRLRDIPQSQMNEVEILGPGKDDRRRIPISDLKGLEIKLELSRDLLVYEIKVPFQSDGSTFAVAANVGDLIGVGLETTKIDMEDMRGQENTESGGQMGGRGGSRGGRGGGGGRGTGGGPGGGRSGGMQMPDQLKIWAKVQLANQ